MYHAGRGQEEPERDCMILTEIHAHYVMGVSGVEA